MKRVMVVLAAVAALVMGSSGPAAAAPGGDGKMSCVVHVGSAAELNAGGTWSFEVFNADPNLNYRAQVTWAGDPSNGGHPNAGIVTDENGYGTSELPAWWAPDGFLPGSTVDGQFVAVPGQFEVRIGPKAYTLPDLQTIRAGKTMCVGVVTE